MPDDPRVQQLLDELLDSNATPEAVCSSCVELLPVVRARWRQVCHARAELDALFPPAAGSGESLPVPLPDATALPTIPGYEVEAVLGVGGMGVVFRARHLRLNRVVALKMALAGEYAGPHDRERFQREAEAVAALRHSNIVQIHDIGDAAGRPYFTMEYIDGGTLGQQLTGVPRLPREAAVLIATLAGAAHAAHECGIVHRDLKPANIFLTADGTPKIGDFGLARRLDGESRITRTGTALGTPSYMAPEQAGEATGKTGPAADVYALGSILYELLTGQPPFMAARVDVTLYQVLTRDPKPPSRRNAKVPRDLETICLKCLQKEPHLRYASAAALGDDLERFLRGEAISARPEGRLERLFRRVRRRPAFSSAVAVSGMLAVAVVGIATWTLSDRAATAHAIRAEEAVTEQAANTDLKEMEEQLRKAAWSQARAARERAMGRLGDRGSAGLRRRLDQGTRELWLVVRLDGILQVRADNLTTGAQSSRSDADYESAFGVGGVGHVHEEAGVVAARVMESNVCTLLLAALDDWAVCAAERRREWLLAVARGADANPGGWRDRARDPKIWRDRKALDDVVRDAPVADPCVPLLLTLDRHLMMTGRDSTPFLVRVQRAHPNDFFVNVRLGVVLRNTGRYDEAVRYFQAAVALRPDSQITNNYLGVVFTDLGRYPEAVEYYRRAVELDPGSEAFISNLSGALRLVGRYDEAFDLTRRAIASNPKAAVLHTALGDLLAARGRLDEAVAQHREAVELNPDDNLCRSTLVKLLRKHGRVVEACQAWGKSLETRPEDHDAWYGYSEYCLFLGREGDYRRGRSALLTQFGSATDPGVAERTGRACLLLPASEDELRQAAALAERSATADRAKYPPGAIACFLFVKGLAEYRRGQFGDAVSTMRGDASRVHGPAPGLVLAMALHQSGQTAAARKTLAAAVASFDWREHQVRDQDGWIYHILRREAEGMILPQLSAFLNGKYQPQDNDERLGLLGACQAANRPRATAGLATDAFAADTKLAEDFRQGRRAIAAVSAVLAGSGRGEDAGGLSEAERAKWRGRALEWLRADLAAWDKAFKADPAANREAAWRRLGQWSNDPDLAWVHRSDVLEKLPAGEREDWAAFWNEVEAILKQVTSGK